MNDTPPEVAEMVRKQLMAKSGAERFLMGIAMFDAARDMVLASLPPVFPNLSAGKSCSNGSTAPRCPGNSA